MVYVDDIKFRQCIRTEQDLLKLQEELNSLYEWDEANNCKFSELKFMILRYGKNNQIKEESIYFTLNMNYVISEVDECRDLGV